MDEALLEWFDREAVYVEDALENASVYQLMCPEIADFWEDFWQHMEYRIEEREHFLEAWRYEHGDLELDTDAEDGVETRHPEDISEMFCDGCETLQFRLFGKGEAAYCGDCFQEKGLEAQTGLFDYECFERSERKVYALVGCGANKKDGYHEASELYVSPYFRAKARFASELVDEWLIVSAKNGVIEPDEEVREYNVEVSDVDAGRWLDSISDELPEYLEDAQDVWVLVGKAYLDATDESGRSLRHVINSTADGTVYYPFEQTSGIGEQQRWLKWCVQNDEAVMPYELWEGGQQSLTKYP